MSNFFNWYFVIGGTLSLALVIAYMFNPGMIDPRLLIVTNSFAVAGLGFRIAYDHYHPEASKH